MSIIPAFTYTLTNGTTADANQVMANFNTVLNGVNNNAATNGTNSNITQITGLTTPLTVAQGGTGLGTLTSNNLYVGNGTSTPTAIGAYTAFFRSFLAGLTLSNDGTTPNSVLDIAAGACIDSTNATLISLGAFTKSTAGSWASGSGSNGMGTGLTIANSTWYHVFAIINSGAADVYFDTSVTAANAPTNTTAFRRIGSFLTDGSSHIIKYSQNGDEFLWLTEVADIATSTLSTSRTAFSLTVPPGIIVNALLRCTASSLSNVGVILQSPTENASVPAVAGPSSISVVIGTGNQGSGHFNIRTNTSGQIEATSTAASTTLNGYTYGWIDSRGKLN